MVTIAATAERSDEPRVGLTPETAKKYAGKGARVVVERGAGLRSRFSDEAYVAAGCTVAPDLAATLQGADLVLKVRRPAAEEVALMKSGSMVLAMLEPFGDRAGLEAIAGRGITSFAMEMMPRITRAQSMDVLSSQSNLAGYKAVLDAAAAFDRALPMMMTAAGTVPAARVFVMGAGVAGLQAIATARRLGAVVTATDVRPAAKEQVASLGAKFIAVEDEEFRQAETAAGYAKPMSAEYQQKQQALVAEHLKTQDIVITTALIPGRPAPRLISKEMVASMKPGAIVLDMAVERGRNCELAKAGETVEVNGVRIIGPLNLAGEVAVNASSLYAKNLFNFLDPLLEKGSEALKINWDDEIIKGTLVTKDGAIVHPALEKKG
ncbi:MAG: Re/Si-specific NAD(P)(+) transhydrogenase subunit alpha [Hyphomicrobiaceae bacterium]